MDDLSIKGTDKEKMYRQQLKSNQRLWFSSQNLAKMAEQLKQEVKKFKI